MSIGSVGLITVATRPLHVLRIGAGYVNECYGDVTTAKAPRRVHERPRSILVAA